MEDMVVHDIYLTSIGGAIYFISNTVLSVVGLSTSKKDMVPVFMELTWEKEQQATKGKIHDDVTESITKSRLVVLVG